MPSVAYTKDRSLRLSYGVDYRGLVPEGSAFSRKTGIVVASRSLSGFRQSDWKDKIRKGLDATSNLSAIEQSYEWNRGHWSQRWFINGYGYYVKEVIGDWPFSNGVSAWTTSAPTTPLTDADNQARASFYKQINQRVRPFSGGVFLGEMRETLHMLRHPSEGLAALSRDFANSLKKRKQQKPKTWLRDVGQMWLEQSFGWRPLINDAKDALKAYESLTQKADANPTIRIRAGASKDYHISNGLNSTFSCGGGIASPQTGQVKFLTTMGSVSDTCTVVYRAGVLLETEAPAWRATRALGFDPLQFIPTAWELMPWSFLVDYFTNVGDILDAAVTRGFNYSYVVRSTIRSRTCRATLKMDRTDTQGVNTSISRLISSSDSGPQVLMSKHKVIDRVVVGAVPLPTLSFNLGLSDGQLLNVAALLSQVNGLYPQGRRR